MGSDGVTFDLRCQSQLGQKLESTTHQLTGEDTFEIAPLQNLDYYFFREDRERCVIGLFDWPVAHDSRGDHIWREKGYERVAEGIEGDHSHGSHCVRVGKVWAGMRGI